MSVAVRLGWVCIAVFASSEARAHARQLGADDCSAPDPIALFQNAAQVSYDTSAATTGTQGQSALVCNQFGTSEIANDVWFTFVATVSGFAEIYTYGTLADTRLALHRGAGCPSAEPLQCNDDDGDVGYLTSWLRAEVTAGQSYTLQVGHYPGTPPESGAISIVLTEGKRDRYTPGDGSAEASVGSGSPGEVAWMQRFDAVGGEDVLTSISTLFGSPLDPSAVPDGSPATAYVWSDPNQDGDPGDAVLLAAVPTTVSGVNADAWSTVVLPSPVTVSGRFFVGFSAPLASAGRIAPLDERTFGSSLGWFAYHAGGAFDAQCLACNSQPPLPLRTLGAGWSASYVFALAASGSDAGTSYCAGDGSASPCPCGNTSVEGAGCVHSAGVGARLFSTGPASVANPEWTLWASSAPGLRTGVFFAGTDRIAGGMGTVFGSGLRCVGGQRIPLAKLTTSSLGWLALPDVVGSFPGTVHAGDTWRFQAWFRDDSQLNPCASSIALSNGLSVTFAP